MTYSPDSSSEGAKPSIEELQAEVEQSRAALSETVASLSAKADVKSRAKARIGTSREQTAQRLRDVQSRAGKLVTDTKAAATDDAGKPTTPVLAGAGGVTAAVVALAVVLIWRSRR